MAYASGGFASAGDAQTSLYVLRNDTNDATETELFLDGVTRRLVEADDVHDALVIKVTGLKSKPVRWVATVRTTEVGW